MPVYEYECNTCGVHFERRQPYHDASLPGCPNGHPLVHRVYSVPRIVFKGSGWYVTDSRKQSPAGSSD
jgi:putative FmdB family regulatory protein